jgi:ABC-type Mn2+/Zn2+ transport system ATPase subunit
MTNPSEMASKSPDKLIKAQGLDIGYEKETIVADINFTVNRGQSLALVGVNGSGKSTLLKTLVGLIAPLRGDLVVFGKIPGKAPCQIAYLSQFHASGFILPLRAIDAVRMGRYADHGLLGRMNSEDETLVIQSMNRMGIKHLKDKPLQSLSGGQQQRVYIAQSLAKHADLLFLDEPTAGLDAGGKELFQQVIAEELRQGVSLVVATHDIQEAISCDNVVLLARKVIAYGKGSEIITPQVLFETFGIVLTMKENNLDTLKLQ